MVAAAAWLTIEPEISLEGFLASDALETGPSLPSWGDDEWAVEPTENATTLAPEDRA